MMSSLNLSTDSIFMWREREMKVPHRPLELIIAVPV